MTIQSFPTLLCDGKERKGGESEGPKQEKKKRSSKSLKPPTPLKKGELKT